MTGVPSRATRRGDDGQLLLLVLGCTLIVALLLTVVVDASRVFLAQRALSGAADAAALAGADAVDEAAFYDHSDDVADGGGAGEVRELVPLDDAAARQAVDGYVTAAGLPARFEDLVVSTALGSGGTSVTVTCSARVRLPFVNVVSAGHAGGYPVSVSASARSPLRP